MLDVCVSPQPVNIGGERKMAPSTKIVPALGVVDLMQMTTQALWVHDAPLKQLPYMDDDALKALSKKNIKTVHAVRKMDPEKRAKVLPDLTPAQWEEIEAVCSLMPNVTLDVEAGVEDEEDVFEGDIVRVRVQLNRLEEDGEGAEVKGRVQLEGSEDKAAADVGEKGVVGGVSVKKEKALEEKEDAASVPSSSTKIIDDRALTEDELADLVPIPQPKRQTSTSGTAPLVHAPYFPYEKREKWMALLVQMDPADRNRPRHIVSFQRVPNLVDRQTVDLRFQAPPVEGAGGKGWQEHIYTLHVLCDSYAGVDRAQHIVLRVKKVKKEEEKGEDDTREEPIRHEKSFFEKLLNPDEEYEAKWSDPPLLTYRCAALRLPLLTSHSALLSSVCLVSGCWQVLPVVRVVLGAGAERGGARAVGRVPVQLPALARLLAGVRGARARRGGARHAARHRRRGARGHAGGQPRGRRLRIGVRVAARAAARGAAASAEAQEGQRRAGGSHPNRGGRGGRGGAGQEAGEGGAHQGRLRAWHGRGGRAGR